MSMRAPGRRRTGISSTGRRKTVFQSISSPEMSNKSMRGLGRTLSESPSTEAPVEISNNSSHAPHTTNTVLPLNEIPPERSSHVEAHDQSHPVLIPMDKILESNGEKDDNIREEDTDASRWLEIDIQKLLLVSKSSFSPTCCIYRSPESVRIHNIAAYMPKLISIGPYHMDSRTQWETELKRVYCGTLIKRSEKSLNLIVKHLEELKLRVYGCYEDNNWDNLPMVLVQSCFIVEHLRRSHFHYLGEPSDNLPLMERRSRQIRRDLLLLDNQIPYFLLESLYELLTPAPPQLKFEDMVMSFFESYKRNDDMVIDFKSVKHFTDLIRTLHKPTPKEIDDSKKYDHFEYTLSATQLHNAGIGFKPVSGNSLLDVDFKDGVLTLPCFKLNDDQESLYRNLMAFELCHYPDDTYIIDYFVFMDALINTAQDISLLIESGVLVNRIGDHSDAANTFNRFCSGITHYNVSDSYLLPVLWRLNKYHRNPSHTYVTTFKRDYFGTPLRTASTLTAVALVVLTFISTVCSIISIL